MTNRFVIKLKKMSHGNTVHGSNLISHLYPYVRIMTQFFLYFTCKAVRVNKGNFLSKVKHKNVVFYTICS